ncbi:AAA family ATPase [Aquisalibacillus elongatus]|uniref:Dynein-related subfamily AAA family protein n=1 Tax=Aquisalibacillus elongatus TaxID=485577 RepID=A0A3N5CDQ2_9BACI|nr:AAA family ATPase [Aquisalibacillus elongatus]RPF55261.1 dynein-related subfamily AAA family protein [Aquisalibacillus elongatus]
MAIYSERDNDRKPIYDAAEKWKNECLLNSKSLIWDGEAIWTSENMQRFRRIFIERPDESGNSFDEKLKKQLNGETEEVYKFVIELLFIYYLFPSSISYDTKMEKIETVASWKGIEIDRSWSIFNSLKKGLGNTGMYFNVQKYFEMSYLFIVSENIKNLPLKTSESILSKPTELKKLAEETRQNQIGKRVQIIHALLHLLLPNYFERIVSWGNKQQIVKAYADLLNDNATTNDLDDKLYIIREKLEEQYPSKKVDFYKEPFDEKWSSTKPKKKKQTPVEESDDGLTIPTIDFNVESNTNGLVFENLDVLMNQVKTAISNGKHIILTGPPGTGKSKLASKICEMYSVQAEMVTATSNWSTYETIGGYRPDRNGNLYFSEGTFLKCVRDNETHAPTNTWLIIDEINRADIDKAFGSLFSVLTGDEVTLPFETKSENSIVLQPQGESTSVEPNDFTYVIPNDWRIIATMNTIDKASLYEMSYAFMRRFAFIPVGIPKDINSELIQKYLDVWEMSTYPHVEALAAIWKIINKYRKIGPARRYC